jgi:hypothetical protein
MFSHLTRSPQCDLWFQKSRTLVPEIEEKYRARETKRDAVLESGTVP